MTAPITPEVAHAAYVTALTFMSPEEEAIPAAYWPLLPDGGLAAVDGSHMPAVSVADATKRLEQMVARVDELGDEPDPRPTPELDAIAALLAELHVARILLRNAAHDIELRHDDELPLTDAHRQPVQALLQHLREDIARCAYHFAEPGDAA